MTCQLFHKTAGPVRSRRAVINVFDSPAAEGTCLYWLFACTCVAATVNQKEQGAGQQRGCDVQCFCCDVLCCSCLLV